MGARIIWYSIKGIASKDLWKLQALAYQAVKHLKIDAKEILIRGDIHDTTTINGKQGQKDPLGAHSTLSFRTEENIRDKTFWSAHAYTGGINDFTLKNVSLAANPLPLTATGRNNKRIWPEGLTQDTVIYVDPPNKSDANPEGHVTDSGVNATGTGGHDSGAHATSHTASHITDSEKNTTGTGNHDSKANTTSHAASTTSKPTKPNPGFISTMTQGLAPGIVSAMISGNMGKKI